MVCPCHPSIPPFLPSFGKDSTFVILFSGLSSITVLNSICGKLFRICPVVASSFWLYFFFLWCAHHHISFFLPFLFSFYSTFVLSGVVTRSRAFAGLWVFQHYSFSCDCTDRMYWARDKSLSKYCTVKNGRAWWYTHGIPATWGRQDRLSLGIQL